MTVMMTSLSKIWVVGITVISTVGVPEMMVSVTMLLISVPEIRGDCGSDGGKCCD